MEAYGKINVYTCSKGHKNVTVNGAEGVTPMIISCREKDCGRNAQSAWYNCPQNLTPTLEWYRPPASKKLNREEADHVIRGGLLLRKIQKHGT